MEAEERDLRGLQYFDVAQELENLIQLTVLRPLHRRLIEDLQHHGCGWVMLVYSLYFMLKDAFYEQNNMIHLKFWDFDGETSNVEGLQSD